VFGPHRDNQDLTVEQIQNGQQSNIMYSMVLKLF
jgi:hypothetical protein